MEIFDEVSILSHQLIEVLRNKSLKDNEKQIALNEHLNKVFKLTNGKAKVPEFKTGLDWINVKEPLLFSKHLENKIVVLDFFTYCCINCMHILPDLKKLELEFPIDEGLVVIGVHSAKFTNERKTSNIKAAAIKYNISHPIVNDTTEGMWSALGVHCWPTLYVIGPSGEPLLQLQGEGHYAALRTFLKLSLKFYKDQGLIALENIKAISLDSSSTGEIFKFPGKVAINSIGKLMAVSDTCNNRILLIDLESNKILEQIGEGTVGLADGNFLEAKFNAPQGIFFGEDKIFVADTENHAIREIDLKKRNVKTLVGNGKQGNDYIGGLDYWIQQISSPWDVFLESDILYVAMAGTHQIWAYFLSDKTIWNKKFKKGKCYAIIGSGREENRNTRYSKSAGLAQPSGLTLDSSARLYFADSESSSIRRIVLERGEVESVVGGDIDPQNLFAFGDLDGKGSKAKLQHPLDVAYCSGDNMVYVADTYNHKLKKVDPLERICTTIIDSSNTKLNEPGGICSHGDLVYIADTNNNCIRVYNTKNNTMTKLDLEWSSKDNKISSKTVHKNTITVNPHGEIEIFIKLELPPGVKLTNDAPSKWTVMIQDERMINIDNEFSLTPSWKFNVKQIGHKRALATCRVFVCANDLCMVKEEEFAINFTYDETAPISVSHNIAHTLKI